MPERIPPDICDFVTGCISTVAELEALLLLREAPLRDWDAPSLARRLYVGESEGARILENLAQYTLAVRTPAGFRYHARDAERQRLVDGLAESHAKFLVPLTLLIHDKASGMRQFADAFKFRKDT